MAYERNPNDPYRPDPANEQMRRTDPAERELQMDPELTEGPASGSRIAIYAIAAAVILGAVFYGLNNSSMNSTAPTSTATTTTSPKATSPDVAQTKPPVAPGVRDVTPSNSQPGTTTGAAPAQPQPAPGATPQMNQTAPPPANGPNTAK